MNLLNMKIIKINAFTIYFLLLFFFCGLIKSALIIFSIVLIHELGHVFFTFILGYKIEKITIYPFGGVTIINKDLNTPINRELIIAFGGIFFQLFLYLLLFLPFFRDITKELIFKYNTAIIFFNMLPIIPLDGSIIVNTLINKFFSFKISYIWQIIVSVIGIILFLIIDISKSLNNYLISSLLIIKTIDYIKNYKYVYNRFLLERYLKNYAFKNIKSNKGSIDILKKDTYQYFIEGKKAISEKQKLQERFDKDISNKL